MAARGYQVLGVGVDAAKAEALVHGRVPFHEPGLPQALDEALASGRLDFTTDFARAAGFGGIHFLCRGTPQVPGSPAAHLRFAADEAAPLPAPVTRPRLIVGSSPAPAQTAPARR